LHPDCPFSFRLLKILNLLYRIYRGKISRKYKKTRGKLAGGFAIDPAVVQVRKVEPMELINMEEAKITTNLNVRFLFKGAQV
jgi:hypothetical protein